MRSIVLASALVLAASGAIAQTPATPSGGGAGSAPPSVRQKIEADGYRNVQGLAKGADGLWHGRAMRGNTEVAVTVDSKGVVAAQ